MNTLRRSVADAWIACEHEINMTTGVQGRLAIPSGRFRLRNATQSDVSVYEQCISDDGWRRMYGFVDSDRVRVLRRFTADDEQDLAKMIVCDGDDAVGFVHFYGHAPEARRCYIGGGALPSTLSAGFFRYAALDAMVTVLRHAFDVFRLHRVVAEVRAYNRNSQRLLQASGFSLEGHLRQHGGDVDGALVDVLVFGLLEEEFRRHESENLLSRFRLNASDTNVRG